MADLSLPDSPTRIVVALAVGFWGLALLFTPVVFLLPKSYVVFAPVVFVPTWLAVVTLWLRRTRGESDDIWAAVSQSQATGRYAESGGISVAEQRETLSDTSDEEE